MVVPQSLSLDSFLEWNLVSAQTLLQGDHLPDPHLCHSNDQHPHPSQSPRMWPRKKGKGWSSCGQRKQDVIRDTSETGTGLGGRESIRRSSRDGKKAGKDRVRSANLVKSGKPRVWSWVVQDGKGFKVRSPFSPLSPPPPHLAQGGRNGTGLRGLFGAVEWKIDFNPLCSCEGAPSASPDQGSRHSGGPLQDLAWSPYSCRG